MPTRAYFLKRQGSSPSWSLRVTLGLSLGVYINVDTLPE